MPYIDLSKAELPQIYKRNGRECYLDPIRKKLVFITPEETFHQKVLSFLLKSGDNDPEDFNREKISQII